MGSGKAVHILSSEKSIECLTLQRQSANVLLTAFGFPAHPRPPARFQKQVYNTRQSQLYFDEYVRYLAENASH